MINGMLNHPYNPNIGLLAQSDHFCHPLITELEQCAAPPAPTGLYGYTKTDDSGRARRARPVAQLASTLR